jgi:hypothetical protein
MSRPILQSRREVQMPRCRAEAQLRRLRDPKEGPRA